jgi:phosphoserine phosphatase
MSEPVRTLVLDVDSTLSGIEGIDWLAARRGDIVSRRVADLTTRAMQGGIALEDIYGARLAEVRPRRDEVDLLSRAYVDAIAPDAVQSIKRIRSAGVQVVIVSGGIRYALLRLAFHLGLGPSDVHAVSVRFDELGAYVGYDTSSPLTMADGKRRVVESLKLDGPVVAAGDGATDLAMREAVDLFVAYTGFVSRPNVVEKADMVAESFTELERVVLSYHSLTPSR